METERDLEKVPQTMALKMAKFFQGLHLPRIDTIGMMVEEGVAMEEKNELVVATTIRGMVAAASPIEEVKAGDAFTNMEVGDDRTFVDEDEVEEEGIEGRVGTTTTKITEIPIRFMMTA